MAAINKLRSRAFTAAKIDLPGAASAPRLCAAWRRRALARTTAPERSTVAIAIGVMIEEAHEADFARVAGRNARPARLITSARTRRGTPAAPNGHQL